MKRLKLFPKTFIYMMIIMTIITIMIHTLIYFLLPSFYFNKKEAEVKNRTEELVEILKETNTSQMLEIAENYATLYNVNITLYMDNKTYQYHGFTPANIYLDPIKAKDILNKDTSITRFDSFNNHTITINQKTFKNKDHQVCDLYLILNTGPIDETKQVTIQFIPYSIGISIIISLIAAYIYSKKMTKPIKNILQSTKDMKQLKKGIYCKVDSDDEIGMIGDHINSLYETIWNTIETLQQRIDEISLVEKEKVDFLRAASHELKTPLTSLHVLLENMRYNIGKYKDRDYYLDKAQEIVIESTNMVQSILDVSKLQVVNKGNEENLDIKMILIEVLESYNVLVKAKNLKVNLDIEDTCDCFMNRDSMKKVLSNIISNAIQYTDEGKQINIQCSNGILIVENACESLSAYELKNVFKPFYRPDFSRNKKDGGTGLGLYIVKDILDDAEFDFQFIPSDLGMKFMIDFRNKPQEK